MSTKPEDDEGRSGGRETFQNCGSYRDGLSNEESF